MSLRRSLLLLLALGLLATACGQAGDPDVATEPDAAAGCDPLPTIEAGTLTVATGEPVFEPWMVDDDPTNGQGFESALVYAVAEQLGIAAEDVTWVRTGFDEAIAPGPKDYDFNIQQYSINADRDEVVDFSRPYYVSEQAIIAAEGSDIADVTAVEELADFRLGAAIGTTSLDYIEEVIEPEEPAQVYNDNASAKAAFDAGQVDGILFDLPTAFFITAVEIPDATIVGVLPRVEEDADALGMLFEEESPLVVCVNQALDALEADGTLAALEEEWLQFEGEIPTLQE
jgi:polar amino acid transport system substrate-binding protein